MHVSLSSSLIQYHSYGAYARCIAHPHYSFNSFLPFAEYARCISNFSVHVTFSFAKYAAGAASLFTC